MKKLIRSGVFETNSSSSHSISVADETKEFVLDTIYPDQNGVIHLYGGEFGWEWFKHNDAMTKANYAAVCSSYIESLKSILIEILKEQTGADDVVFNFTTDYSGENWSYIDHESVGICPTTKDELKNFIFNKNSWLFGGNDNSQADPTFYHVPEYRGNRMIVPEYKYELKVEGYNKTTKFITNPTKEELDNGLDSLMSSVYLFDFGKGPFFDDDNSVYAQMARNNNYFEFRSWNNNPVDYDNHEITFVKDSWNDAVEIYKSRTKTKDEDWSIGYKKAREIEKELIKEHPEIYIRRIKFSLVELTK